MKPQRYFLLALCALIAPAGLGQSGEMPQHAREELRQRFEQALVLYGQRQWERALRNFQLNLAADAQSRGSLLYGGLTLIHMGKFIEAAIYLDRFVSLEPESPDGLIGAIKAHQALRHDKDVSIYRGRLFSLKESKKDERLNLLRSYEREIVLLAENRQVSCLESLTPNDGGPRFRFLLIEPPAKTLDSLELVPLSPEHTQTLETTMPQWQGKRPHVLARYSRADAGGFGNLKIEAIFPADAAYEDVRARSLELLEAAPVPQ
jgi:tetratricopeptide (TPR) repeat protein